MKTNQICVLLLSFFLVKMDAFAQKAVIKVACIGNSITYGANIPNRNKNSYPAQLQAYLGSDYEVRNYGISGCTLLSKGDYPYVKDPCICRLTYISAGYCAHKIRNQ